MGARVLMLETRPKPGAKIRVSGGGRCNVLPSEVRLDDFHTRGSPHVLRNVLFSWPLNEVRAFFERDLAIPLKVEATGKVFPVSDRPLDVVEALLGACARASAQLVCGFRVVAIRRPEAIRAANDAAGNGARVARFELEAEDGRRLYAERLILATGGLSLPKTGSDGTGLRIAAELGLPVVPTYPALVPITSSDPSWKELAGISVRARIRAMHGERILEERERELLVTHRGWSGPVVLDMSRHVADPGAAGSQLRVRWGGSAVPDWELALRPTGGRRVRTLLAESLPPRLADHLLRIADVPLERRESDMARPERRALVEVLEHYPLPVAGNEGYATAEVTGGGIALSALHSKSLESRQVPGLYLCGEILDATGRIGGYNFLWAWITGRAAGIAAGRQAAA